MHRYAHLEALGVSVVYFGPLFESSDLGHGYDTADYMNVDRRLGKSSVFAEVVAELAARGMQVCVLMSMRLVMMSAETTSMPTKSSCRGVVKGDSRVFVSNMEPNHVPS